MCILIQLTYDDFGNIVEEQLLDSGGTYAIADIWEHKEADMYIDYVTETL